jgi:hypothetical protein
MKIKHPCVLLFCLLLFSPSFVTAQESVDLSIGLGRASLDSTGYGIYDSTSPYAFQSCILGSGDQSCKATPSLDGLFLGFSGTVMLSEYFGIGAQFNFQPTKDEYGPLEYRQTFYDFNAIFAPLNRDRVVFELQGGLGGAKTGFSYTQTSCVGTAVCSTYTDSVGNSNHFQLHAGAGLKLFLTDNIFVQPQFDLHYVPNFTDQFGGNTVPRGSIFIGFRQAVN